MRSTAAIDHMSVVRRINATLQGPVVDVLGELIPEVRRLPKRGALEAILDNVELLDRCFQAFRANPEQFRHLLIDRHKVEVDDAEALLECGRSLEQVIAMVVRTAAKRHFRLRLDGTNKSLRKRPRRQDRQGLLARLRALLSASPQPVRKTARSRAELLYAAFQDYLLHDWQVPIIPEYCLMSPGMVRRLGPRILDYRLAEDIRRLRADPDNPPPPTPVIEVPEDGDGKPIYQLPDVLETGRKGMPTPITTADKRLSDGMAPLLGDIVKTTEKDERARLADILTGDGKRLKANAFTIALLDPKVRSLLPNSEQTVRVTSIFGTVNGLVGKMLVGDLGLRTDQLAVFVMAAHGALGEDRFLKAFGIPGRPDYIGKIVQRAKAANIGQKSDLKQISDFVITMFAAAEAAQKR
ncbi:hypothetical protein [Magnetospirillum sulfuroxidans]|uniref:DUF2336 domain-containing protein n=1 Tax=Magnetospirillum sulfuroxidans TaxID=611300 RepID=A0ABS5IGP0_9PROT|nr:hypothetical protein [Magnetospirillum sulfuroxidans]MBR9973597.1 hypothetical protein [Magnetospirillum sulfuroxidans]